MATWFEPRAVNQPHVPIRITTRSLLLVSSGVVRKCDKEGMMTKVSKWVARWGRSATTKSLVILIAAVSSN